MYRPGDAKPTLPTLGPESPLSDYLHYAMLNNPRVEGAYYTWAALVEHVLGTFWQLDQFGGRRVVQHG